MRAINMDSATQHNTRAWWVFLVCAILFFCFDYFFRISPSLVVTPLMQQYQVSSLGIGSMASAFYIGYVIMQIPGGILLDHYPLRWTFIIAISTCALAFTTFALGHNFITALASRFLIGIASGISFTGVLHIARCYLPKAYFTTISGITIALGTLSASLMQTASAYLMQHYSWHSLFIGASLLSLIIVVVLFFNHAEDHQENSTPSLTHRWQGILTSINDFFRRPKLILNGIVGSLFYLPTSIFAGLWGVSFLEHAYHLSKASSAMGITWLFAGWAMGSPVIGWLSGRMSCYRVFMSSFALLATITSLLLIYQSSMISGQWVPIIMLAFGLLSSAQVMTWKLFNEFAPARLSGLGIALTNMTIMFSGALFHSFVGWLLDSSSYSMSTADFGVGLAVIPLAFFSSSVLSLFLKSKKNSYV